MIISKFSSLLLIQGIKYVKLKFQIHFKHKNTNIKIVEKLLYLRAFEFVQLYRAKHNGNFEFVRLQFLLTFLKYFQKF